MPKRANPSLRPPENEDFAWFLWELYNPPPRRAWYHVILPDGDMVSAMYMDGSRWWTIKRGFIDPLFWRDAPYAPRDMQKLPLSPEVCADGPG